MDDFLRDRIRKDLDEQRLSDEHKQWLSNQHESLDQAAQSYLGTRIRLDVAALMFDFAWAPTEKDFRELGTAAGLMGQISGAVDRDGDGVLSETETEAFETYLDTVTQFLESAGVTDDDIEALFDEDEETANRIRALLLETLPPPDGAEAEALITEFGLNAGDADLQFDSASKPGWSWARRHRGRATVNSKHGKKNVTHHRPRWKKATPGQMVALRKARTRAHTSMAKVLNRRSNKRTREKLGGRKVV